MGDFSPLGRDRRGPYIQAMSGGTKSDPPRWQTVQEPAGVPSLAMFDRMARDAFRRLPDEFRGLCEDLVIRVEDYPTGEVVRHMGLDSEYDLLGLFQGVGLPFRSVLASGEMPNMIWLYRRPILAYWAEHDETLEAIVTHVLVHEIGHHFGLSDEDIDRIEAGVE